MGISMEKRNLEAAPRELVNAMDRTNNERLRELKELAQQIIDARDPVEIMILAKELDRVLALLNERLKGLT